MKRISVGFQSLAKLIIASSCVFALTLAPSAALALTGAGTAARPWLVSNGADFDAALNEAAEAYYPVGMTPPPVTSPDVAPTMLNASDMHYISLTSDIDAITSATYGEEDTDHPVRVTIEGNGHAIRGTLPADPSIVVSPYTGLRFANRTPWTETAPGTGRGNHIILKNLTISGLYNKESHGGGAFAIFGGKFEADNCVFSGNAAYGGVNRGGGAILLQHRASVMAIRNSTFVNNTATGAGGAIDSSGDQPNDYVPTSENVIIENSTFYGNKSTSANGGGAIAYSRALGRIANCTIVGNEATNGKGGGVLARDNITGNASGLGNHSEIFLVNNIVAGNLSNSNTDVDLVHKASVITTEWARIIGVYNIIGEVGTALSISLSNTTDHADVSVILEPGAPKVNGRGTPTIALLDDENSPAIDKGIKFFAPATDQRGYERDDTPDIGAYEVAGEEEDDDLSSGSGGCNTGALNIGGISAAAMAMAATRFRRKHS